MAFALGVYTCFIGALSLTAYIVAVSQDCPKCAPGTYQKEPCTDVRGPVCEPCAQNRYIDYPNTAFYCFECKTCQFGQIVTRPCTPTTNTKCECKDGHYWKVFGADGFCVKHSACEEDQIVIQKGTTTEDRVCGPRTGGDKNKEGGTSGSWDLHGGRGSILTPPTILICVAAIYVIYRLYKKYRPRGFPPHQD